MGAFTHQRPRTIVLLGVGVLATVGLAFGLRAIALTPADEEALASARTAPTSEPSSAPAGDTVITLLGDPVSYDVTGARVITLADAPDEATHVRVSVVATNAGSLLWGTDAGGNNPSVHWDHSDVADGPSHPSFDDFPLAPGIDAVYLDPSGGYAGTVTLQFAQHEIVPYAVNENGQTYGSLGDGPEPDLIAVAGLGPDGEEIVGYVYAEELDAGHPEQFSSPEDALQWQAEYEAEYPDGRDVPVYESDGITQIATFRIG